jgi:prefoldin alpha subunit
MKPEIEKKIEEFNLLEMKLNEMGQQVELIEKQVNEFKSLEMAFDKFQAVGKKTDMFSMIGQDTFIQSELKDNTKILVNIGSKIFVKKTIKETKENIEKRIEKINAIYLEMEKESERILDRLKEIGEEIKIASCS